MRYEIRKSGGVACEKCGAFDLVYAGGKPLTADLTFAMEREIVKRELAVARLARDHIRQVQDDMTTREEKLAEAFAQETESAKAWLVEEHRRQVEDVAETLERAKVDVSWWRLARRRRERIFAERIDAIVSELPLATKQGSE